MFQQQQVQQQQPIVAVPNLSHSTVAQILTINTHLIKILAEYQHHGWQEEPEFKIYQARLQSNLTYLATAADFMGKPDPAKLMLLQNTPNMAAVEYPERLRRDSKANAAVSLVADVNGTDAAEAAGDYVPVPPFAVGKVASAGSGGVASLVALPPGEKPGVALGVHDAKDEIGRRLAGGE
ncbi:hypothetical protein HDU98_000873 [Podochytrium sp. JEL0797]|nr:hypothetical protein HDU98_000873 [Podochytrium sp. JEL0797]